MLTTAHVRSLLAGTATEAPLYVVAVLGNRCPAIHNARLEHAIELCNAAAPSQAVLLHKNYANKPGEDHWTREHVKGRLRAGVSCPGTGAWADLFLLGINSCDTIEEAVMLRLTLSQHLQPPAPLLRLAVVTSPYHSRRAGLVLARALSSAHGILPAGASKEGPPTFVSACPDHQLVCSAPLQEKCQCPAEQVGKDSQSKDCLHAEDRHLTAFESGCSEGFDKFYLARALGRSFGVAPAELGLASGWSGASSCALDPEKSAAVNSALKTLPVLLWVLETYGCKRAI
jgi:hypothetical protein